MAYDYGLAIDGIARAMELNNSIQKQKIDFLKEMVFDGIKSRREDDREERKYQRELERDELKDKRSMEMEERKANMPKTPSADESLDVFKQLRENPQMNVGGVPGFEKLQQAFDEEVMMTGGPLFQSRTGQGGEITGYTPRKKEQPQSFSKTKEKIVGEIMSKIQAGAPLSQGEEKIYNNLIRRQESSASVVSADKVMGAVKAGGFYANDGMFNAFENEEDTRKYLLNKLGLTEYNKRLPEIDALIQDNNKTIELDTLRQKERGGLFDKKETKSVYKEGQTAVNPKTKERMEYRGGKWVKIQ